MWGNFVESLTLNCRLNGVNFNCIVDSGASCSLITTGILRKLGPVNVERPDRVLKDASQNIIRLLGKVTLKVQITGDDRKTSSRDIQFFVSDSDNTNCLL